ncbi:MAG: Rrf2 family transcriptional regulator [Acidimicrobiia bacterium]|nr:Rrf2 family transcriptional regulator [Acidimicrobiia bacterium]
MQASLGRKGDYSVRAVLDLARHDGDRRKAREIASEMDIPHRYLTQILANLVQQGVLTAEAGPTGGYVLARPSQEITLLEVVEAAEGPIGLEQCVLRGGPCSWENSCPVHIPWARAQAALAEQLAATTFADMARYAAELEAGTHELPADTPPHEVPTLRRVQEDNGKTG